MVNRCLVCEIANTLKTTYVRLCVLFMPFIDFKMLTFSILLKNCQRYFEENECDFCNIFEVMTKC